ncbi:hypothetical protein [Sulfurimonas sp.]|uniref:hypothetical protein n=1 Tax=Sulfurimonas sp. TaxID=2022749 RepID=UPI001A0612F6|nr:hypothetical protein [Sulfurimonas sp.]MBE0513928.1 hypothetical protein [Sulfurimonas sp.]
MEYLDKLIIGFLLFLITSIFTYLFKMRQLYAVSPKLFKITPISEKGSLCEVIIFNKGNQVEEQIYLDLDSELKLELLASSCSGIKLDKSALSINRLHKGEEASALLLVENGVIDYSKLLRLTSKDTTGKIFKTLNDIQPNYAKLFLYIVLFISIFPGLHYGTKGYELYQSHRANTELQKIYNLGWSNLSGYYSSDLKKSYSKQEFPVYFLEVNQEESALMFEAYNKTAIPFEITINGKFRKEKDYRYFKNIPISPMSKTNFTIPVPKKIDQEIKYEYEFSFKFGNEYLHRITYVYSH